ncbi:hypothetical protein FXO37_21246 [Capsicum annuum]|nr:hypothetical protein FXO37_21246 [Capsicum annuum]
MSRSEHEPLPLIYPIGPILNQSKSRSESEEAETTNWLDEQPLNSVVLICFGSQGSLQAEQVNEIAIALENIGCRILWSLRRPPQSNNAQFPGEYTSYSEILPEGLLGRTEKKGKVVGWVPTIEGVVPRSSRGIRVTLWMELNTRKHMVWGAYSNMAIALRTAGKCISVSERSRSSSGVHIGLLRKE